MSERFKVDTGLSWRRPGLVQNVGDSSDIGLFHFGNLLDYSKVKDAEMQKG
jgi:hypothetical protein